MQNRAVFLDRDGILNCVVLKNGRPRPPSGVDEVEILPGVLDGLRRLKDAGYVLIVVSNQPDVVRGATPLETVEQNDLEALKSFLKGIGLTSDDLNDLQGALTQDGKQEKETIGKRVQDWIGKMVGKAVGGSWKTALGTAPMILKEAIFRYYGWK